MRVWSSDRGLAPFFLVMWPPFMGCHNVCICHWAVIGCFIRLDSVLKTYELHVAAEIGIWYS